MQKIIPLLLAFLSLNAASQTPFSSTTVADIKIISAFRITLNGFQCNKQTWDDALNRDGWGDEVYFMTKVNLQRPGAPFVDALPTTTFQYGDINGRPFGEQRIMAGMGNPDINGEAHGGVLTGDKYPSNIPWKRNANLFSQNKLPLLMWQGMVQPNDIISIIPTVWEWDGEGSDFDHFLQFIGQPIITLVDLPYNNFNIAAVAENDRILRDIGNALGSDLILFHTVPLTGNEIGQNVKIMRSVFGDPKDRPIGMHTVPDAGYAVFQPVILTFNKTTLENIANIDKGYGKGVIPVTYTDDNDLGNGSYTLFIQIEKINAPEINKPISIVNENTPVRIVNVNSAKALEIKDKSTANEGAAQQWDYWGGNNQQWKLKLLDNGNYLIQNINSQKYLEVFGSSQVNGGRISQWDYNGNPNQQWKIEHAGQPNAYIFRNAASNKVLDVAGVSKDNGATVQQWDSNNGGNQSFYIAYRGQNN